MVGMTVIILIQKSAKFQKQFVVTAVVLARSISYTYRLGYENICHSLKLISCLLLLSSFDHVHIYLVLTQKHVIKSL